MMPVGETVYCDGELIVLAVYKEPQDIREIQYADAMNLDPLEGNILMERIVMQREIDYVPLFRHLAFLYGPQMEEYDILEEKKPSCSDEQWRTWSEARWAYQLNERDSELLKKRN